MTPGGERSGVGGRTCRSRPGGKGLGGNGLGGLVWVWVGLAWARYFALTLPTAAAAAAAGEASAARAGFFPRLRGVLGAAAWPAEAVSRPAGVAAAAPRAPSSLSFAAVLAADEAPVAAVATPRTPSSFSSAAAAAAGGAPAARAGSVPRVCGALQVAARPAEVVSRPAGVAAAAPRAPSPLSFAAVAAADEAPVARAVATPCEPFLLSSAAAAALGDAPGSCAGAAPRVGGVPGAAVGAAAWLAAVSASCVSGRGGAAGLAAWAAGAVASAGPGSQAGGGGPTSTAASARLRSSRSARVSPVHSGEETGERERDRRWWRSSRWGDPSESAITVTLVGMRGGRRALPTTSWCISAVPWAVPCGALRGGGGWGAGCGVSPARPGACGLPPALGAEAGEPRGPRVAPQLPVWGGAQGPGPPGVVERCRGQPHQVDPHNGRDLLCAHEGVYSVPRRGRREGGAGYGCCPIEVGGGDPQDPPRVPAGRDDEEEEGGARALLPEDLPPVVGTPGPGEGGGQVWVSPAAGRVRRRREGGAPSGLPGERLVDDGVRGGRPGAVVHRVGRPGAGGRLVRAFHEHRDLAHLQVLVRRV